MQNTIDLKPLIKTCKELTKELSSIHKKIKLESHKLPAHLENKRDHDFGVLCSQGNLDDIKILVEQPHIDINYSDGYPLWIAIDNGHINVVEFLLEKGADPSLVDNCALNCAVWNKSIDIVKMLLSHPKVDPNVKCNGVYPIEVACDKNNYDMASILLQDSRMAVVGKNNIRLMIAAQEGESEVVKLLLKDHDVDPSSLNNTALRLAVHNDHDKVVKILLKDLRVNPSVKNNKILKKYMEERNRKIVSLILKHPNYDSPESSD